MTETATAGALGASTTQPASTPAAKPAPKRVAPSVAKPPQADVPPCDIHGGVQQRPIEHVGDGHVQWGDPVCPYCEELAAAKPPKE